MVAARIRAAVMVVNNSLKVDGLTGSLQKQGAGCTFRSGASHRCDQEVHTAPVFGHLATNGEMVTPLFHVSYQSGLKAEGFKTQGDA